MHHGLPGCGAYTYADVIAIHLQSLARTAWLPKSDSLNWQGEQLSVLASRIGAVPGRGKCPFDGVHTLRDARSRWRDD
jgi:hypothetical protein